MRRLRTTQGTIAYLLILIIGLVVPISAPKTTPRYLREQGSIREWRGEFSWPFVADVVVNVVAFVPLGWGVRRSVRRRGITSAKAIVVVAVSMAGFSLAMETVQYFLASRRSSLIDVAANTVGGLLGAALQRRTREG